MPDQGTITYSIASELHGAAAAAVRHMWRNLEAHFGLRAAQSESNPAVTFSLFTTRPAQEQALIEALAGAAVGLEPFSLFLDGVSSTEGESPEMFLRVLKSDGAEVTFNAIWRALSTLEADVQPAFQPAAWMPRCMLACTDMKPEQIHKVRNYLRTQVVKWRSQVKTINLYRMTVGEPELVHAWPLGEQTVAEPIPEFWV